MQGYTLSLGVAEDAGTTFPIVFIVTFRPSAVAFVQYVIMPANKFHMYHAAVATVARLG
jgi:hypothetical protein